MKIKPSESGSKISVCQTAGHLQRVPQDGSQMVFFKHRRSLNWFSSCSRKTARLIWSMEHFGDHLPHFHWPTSMGSLPKNCWRVKPLFLRPKVTSQFLVKSMKVYEISQWNPTKILVNTIKSYEIILNHTKTWCRASEGAPAVVTFQTFYRGTTKRWKTKL